MPRTLIKVCGLFRPEDIDAVNEYQPDFAGFVIDFPKSHRSIGVSKLRELTGRLNRATIKAVGVFVNSPFDKVLDLLQSGVIDIAQLHGSESDEYITELKQKSGKPVIKAFVIKSLQDVESAKSTLADYPLLDAGLGEGQVFNHQLAANFTRPFFLAGGLSAENLQSAIQTLNPFVVDLSSSVEDKAGFKVPEKIKQVIQIVRST